MTVNENVIRGKWLEIRGELQKSWGQLTDNELDQTKGDMKAIGGLIQQKYGKAQDQFEAKLSEILNRQESTKNKVVDNIKDALKK